MKPILKYKPKTVQIRPWEEIEKSYIDLVSHGFDFDSILGLIKFIRNNSFEDRLFGYTSLEKLIITIYNPAEWHRESLHVGFDRHTKRWQFEYYSKPGEPIGFERYYSEEIGLEKFSQFIEWIKW